MENPVAPVVDNPATQEAPVTQPESNVGGWRSSLRSDLRDSPMFKTFEDTPEGLNKAFESHGNLQKLLGHEKVPVPKDEKDIEGWARYKKAFGVPEKADGYNLPDVKLPESMKGITLDKTKFAEVIHSQNLTPAQAQNLWKAYSELNTQNYTKHLEELQKKLDGNINSLKQEWGDAYQTNVELGQNVINKFSDDKEMNDFVTASLLQDPKGIKFLKKLGEQFAENKVGDFQPRRFTLTPDEAKNELEKIRKDQKHPYNDLNATRMDHDKAVEYVNSLEALVFRSKGQA